MIDCTETTYTYASKKLSKESALLDANGNLNGKANHVPDQRLVLQVHLQCLPDLQVQAYNQFKLWANKMIKQR